MPVKIAILGAGISGLQAANMLRQRGLDFKLLESEPTIGGLARTAGYRHWRYDFGVKALYSKNAQVMDYLRSLPIEYSEHDRCVQVHHVSNGQSAEVDYPFENGIGQLPHEDKVACVLGYLEAYAANKPFANFQEWIVNRLGYGIANQFMLPYNHKIWDAPLEEISMGLVSGKIHPAPIEEIVRIALGEKIVGRQYQAKFIYPREGLTAMIDAMAAPIREQIKTNFRVAEIARQQDEYRITSVSGEQVECSVIISTIPLLELGGLFTGQDMPQPKWRYNKTLFYVVFLNQAPAHGLHWHFFAAPQFPFYRLTYMHNFSDKFAPCIVAEVTDRNQKVETERVLEALGDLGIRRSWIEDVKIERLGYTYPIPTLRSDAEKPWVIARFEAEHVYPLGRAGSWSYLNVDGIILQAWERVPQIVERELGSS